ncbi:hypothetical protein PENSPDRAFT_390588 [Peniophora sp. CONT]|nr:hypothetical protein PENSPDRAFT_390588 [Peniophora sp. CONT]
MKFFSTITAVAAALAVEGAPSPLDKRQYYSVGCGPASKSMVTYDHPFVYPLFNACLASLGNSVAARENPWISKTCVAAAVAATMPTLASGLECGVNTTAYPVLTLPSTWPSLDYNVYASIVGDCAWAPGGCPITQQNFIDLVYGAIAETTGGPYPRSAELLIEVYIKPIFDWAAFDISKGVPYLNFNDWLHWGPSATHCESLDCST